MKIPFLKLFESSSKKIPELIKQTLVREFPGAINIEWDKKDNFFEALFYQNDTEHIAVFSPTGDLLECKKNTWPDDLPELVANECKKQGEIMNVISVFKNNKTCFEVIVRDSSYNRTLLFFDSDASLTASKKL